MSARTSGAEGQNEERKRLLNTCTQHTYSRTSVILASDDEVVKLRLKKLLPADVEMETERKHNHGAIRRYSSVLPLWDRVVEPFTEILQPKGSLGFRQLDCVRESCVERQVSVEVVSKSQLQATHRQSSPSAAPHASVAGS